MLYITHFLHHWHRWRPCIVVMSVDGQWVPYAMCGCCRLFAAYQPFNLMLVWQDGAPRGVSTINGERP